MSFMTKIIIAGIVGIGIIATTVVVINISNNAAEERRILEKEAREKAILDEALSEENIRKATGNGKKYPGHKPYFEDDELQH